MSNKQSIIKSCEHSINVLTGIRKNLLDVGGKDREITWAVGSLYIVLINGLLTVIEETFQHVVRDGAPNAKDDLCEIRYKFCAFIDTMIKGE